MTIKSSGNIGIGTDAPTNLLHVNSATSGAVKIVDGTQGANKVLTSDANGVATWKDIPAQSFTDTSIYAGNGTLSSNRTVAQAGNTLAFMSTATTGTNHFSVDGSTLSVDAATNRVGIGTTAPNSTLQVVGGEMRVGGSASQAGTIDNPILRIHSKANAAGLGGQIRFNENDTNYGYYIKHNTATGDQGFDGLAIGSSQPGKYTENISRPGLFVADNQNVGVGTASPQTILHIDSNFDNNVNAAPSTAQQINDVVITRTSGNVGIGTTNPSTKLEVNGNLKVNDTKELTSSTISPLYVDQNGLVGKAPVVGSQVAHFRGDALDAPPGSVTLSNINQSIPTPLVLQPNHRFINTMGADVINGNIKITRSGYYQFGGMINFYLASSVNEYYWILINVQKSSDNGSTWNNINGIRAIINGAANRTYSYSQIIPQTIEQFNSGDLVRIVIYRTNLGGQPQGNEIRKLHVISSVPGAIYGYTFSMSKL
ncbi:hypothetical protein [Chryseobacterium sp. MMS23-Vi53]|uniref:hypothetical protein n=1 Tax=Chryseobacterium sp. MMS23-Vi53 TaxID=3386644 RepID=UPI0039E87F47